MQYPGLREADEQALFEFGRKLRYHPAFPKGANVNFLEKTGETGFMNGPGSGAWRISPTPAARGRRVGLRAGGKAAGAAIMRRSK